MTLGRWRHWPPPRGRQRPDSRDAQIAALRKEKDHLEQELAKVRFAEQSYTSGIQADMAGTAVAVLAVHSEPTSAHPLWECGHGGVADGRATERVGVPARVE